MGKKFDQGFTFVELLVVIAIIGVLSSVILFSTSQARNKATNTAIKADLNIARGQAGLFLDDPSLNGGLGYLGLCINPNFLKEITAAHTASGLAGSPFTQSNIGQTITTTNCHSSTYKYAVSVPLKAPEGTSVYWCIDSAGNSVGRISALGQNKFDCPSS